MRQYITLGVLLLCLSACKNSTIDEDIISSGTNTPPQEKQKIENLDKASYAKLAHIFLDNQTIASNQKTILIVFGANACSACQKLQDSIIDTPSLQKKLQEEVSPYYINISYTKNHTLEFELDSESKVLNTSALANLYGVNATPTLVFLTPSGKMLFAYPGFLMPKRFERTIDFFNDPNNASLTQTQIAQKLIMLYEKEQI
ncbi:thioredoxin family protein [uncultured Helicobacter sp.]|uniref:thioredoxin family protein n=1 Tax=uncultured Helicobacter sp. TaxID=175537 RepID=UPI001C39692A|nr:thioredoxin fold domain-containing protein [Candidatus Helicobacter avicola]